MSDAAPSSVYALLLRRGALFCLRAAAAAAILTAQRNLPTFAALRKWMRYCASLRRTRHILANWQNRSVARALHSWQGWVADRAHALSKMELAVGAFSDGDLRRGLNGWLSGWASAKERNAVLQELRRIIAYLMHQSLAKAFRHWLLGRLGQCRNVELVAAALAKWRSKGLTQGWNSWASALRVLKEWGQRAVAGLAGLINYDLRKALNTWMHFYAEVRAARASAQGTGTRTPAATRRRISTERLTHERAWLRSAAS